MISTRQLIFIISIVLFFVNRAKFCHSCSSSSSSKQHLNNCMLELTTAFQSQENTFDNLLYAFLNLNKADFEVKRTYTKAAYAYFNDLLNTAHDIITQPMIENPRNYCENHYGYQVENCIRNIAELGCKADDDAMFCVKNLYFNWKKSYMRNCIPKNGTEDISDQELMNAMSKATDIFSGLSNEDLMRYISDSRLLDNFYAKNEHRRENIERLRSRSDYYASIEKEEKDLEDRFQSIGIKEKARDAYAKYSKQRKLDVKEVRYECYGIADVDYDDLVKEFDRRQKIYKNHYAIYLYKQLEIWGHSQLDEKEKNNFQDPENFCAKYLSNNLDYYNYLNNE